MIEITTQEHLKRAMQSLHETEDLIRKECSYLPKFQKVEYLSRLECHAGNLRAAIRAYQQEE